MTVEIYNTLSRRKQPLEPLEPGHVRMYVCGVTTYDRTHIGHGRTFVAFDVMQRWLRAAGYRVTYVRNITDIDDKIIQRAAENGETPSALTARFIRLMHDDFDALGMARPDHEPRATQFIPQMLDLIGLLQDKGLAYQANDGDVNYAVRSFPGYGKLSGRELDELRAGERVAVDTSKRDPLDFVLWKRAKPGEPHWASRWGEGRPGWHIECSAMASELLGRHFDLHGGGPDLIFPHHENEIAQSEGAFDEPFANLWVHTGALRMGDDKMSKSLGNVVTIRDAVDRFDWEVVRFYLLRTHYRSPFNFSDHNLDDARNALRRLYTALDGLEVPDMPVDWTQPQAAAFRDAMNDDFNTPLAASVLFELAGELNRTRSLHTAALLKGLGKVLGVLQQSPRSYLQGGHALDEARIQALIDQRTAAKKARDFAAADRIRDELAAMDVVLKDSATGTTWVKA